MILTIARHPARVRSNERRGISAANDQEPELLLPQFFYAPIVAGVEAYLKAQRGEMAEWLKAAVC